MHRKGSHSFYFLLFSSLFQIDLHTSGYGSFCYASATTNFIHFKLGQWMHINEHSCSGLQLRTHTICNYTATTKNMYLSIDFCKYIFWQAYFLPYYSLKLWSSPIKSRMKQWTIWGIILEHGRKKFQTHFPLSQHYPSGWNYFAKIEQDMLLVNQCQINQIWHIMQTIIKGKRFY